MKYFQCILIVTFGLFLGFQPVDAQDKKPLSLDAAIALALENNNTINIAENQLVNSEYALKEAKGNFLPKAYLSAGYNRNIDRQVIFLPEGFGLTNTATELGSDNDYRAALNMSLPVYSNYNFVNKRLNETRLNYQQEIKRGIEHSTINLTKKAYFNYLIIQEVVSVQQSRLTNAEDSLEDIKKRLAQGTLTDYDLTTAKVQVANAKNNLLEAQSNLLPAANSLKLMLGLKTNETLVLTEVLRLQEDEIVLNKDAQTMLDQNSRLKQLDFDIALSEDQIEMTKSAYYPTLDAIGNYNYQAQADDFKFNEYDWVNTSLVGLQLQFSIFNGNVTKNKVAQAKIAKDIAELEKDYTTQEYQMQYAELLSQLDFSRQKVVVQEENMNLTEDALALSKKRYNFGVGTFLEVNDAELAYTQARLNWLQSILNYKSAFYDYQLLIGKE